MMILCFAEGHNQPMDFGWIFHLLLKSWEKVSWLDSLISTK